MASALASILMKTPRGCSEELGEMRGEEAAWRVPFRSPNPAMQHGKYNITAISQKYHEKKAIRILYPSTTLSTAYLATLSGTKSCAPM